MASNPVLPRAGDRGYADAERIGFGVLMIGAPLLMLGAALFHPPHGIESGAQYYSASHDHGTRFYVAHTLFFLSAVLFVPAVVGLARLVHPTHPRASFWGCVLSLMGFVGYGALDGIDYMTWVAGKDDTGLDPVAMQAFIDEALHTRAVLIPVLLVFTLLPIGLIVLAVGVHRAGIAPEWLAALMALGMVGVAATLQYPVLLVISALALLAGFGTVGVKLLRAPSASRPGVTGV
ncbi:DUF4386 family protein [Streptomyces goshikiensis]|uniref:DUF4386 family protein n=1 Tax=Streptomyces goshikiensis TaxID=1942 RepID=UPI00368ABFD3